MNVPRINKREPYHPLAYVFIYFALITGISFMVMSLSEDATGITMYEVLNRAIGFPGTFIFGLLSTVAGCATLLFYFHRRLWIATAASLLGAGLWLFLTWLYIFEHFYDGVLAASIPNLWFWGWFYIKSSEAKKTHYGNPDYSSRKSLVRSRTRGKRQGHVQGDHEQGTADPSEVC